MPEFSIKVGKKTYKVEASTKKEAETKIMEYVSKTNKKLSKNKRLKKKNQISKEKPKRENPIKKERQKIRGAI